MKSLKILFLFSIIWSLSFAQENSLDPEADALLKSVSAKYNAYKTAKIDLKLVIDLPDIDENQVSNVIAWIKGDKFKIDLKDQLFISDNVTLWNYMAEYNEVQINNFEESDAIFSPSVIFNLYTKDYVYRIKEEYKDASGAVIKIIELSPKNKDQNFFKIDLKISVAKLEIKEAKIYEKSGMRYTYLINSFTPNVELSESFFKFDPSKYPGIEVIDARF